jgi:hypothetical protein
LVKFRLKPGKRRGVHFHERRLIFGGVPRPGEIDAAENGHHGDCDEYLEYPLHGELLEAREEFREFLGKHDYGEHDNDRHSEHNQAQIPAPPAGSATSVDLETTCGKQNYRQPDQPWAQGVQGNAQTKRGHRSGYAERQTASQSREGACGGGDRGQFGQARDNAGQLQYWAVDFHELARIDFKNTA